MFAVDCPTCQTRVLLGPDHIVAITNTPDGPLLSWSCWCGTTGELAAVTRRDRRAEVPA